VRDTSAEGDDKNYIKQRDSHACAVMSYPIKETTEALDYVILSMTAMMANDPPDRFLEKLHAISRI